LRYTACMQAVYLNALFKAELAITLSHRDNTFSRCCTCLVSPGRTVSEGRPSDVILACHGASGLGRGRIIRLSLFAARTGKLKPHGNARRKKAIFLT
jgi:hypothetical protein